MQSADALVDYVANGLGWEWCENGACIVVYTRSGGPIRVFVPLPNIWATFDREFVKAGIGQPANVGDFSVGGFFDKIHRAAGGQRRVGYSNWWGPASIPDLLKHLAKSGPFMWPGDPPVPVAGGTGEFAMDLGTWLKIHPYSRPDLWNRITQADRDYLLSRWPYQTLMTKHPPSKSPFAEIGRAAKSTVSTATKAVTSAVKSVKKTAEKAALHAVNFVDKNLGFIPGVKQIAAVHRKGLEFGQKVDRLAGKAIQNPYVQMGLSAVVPGAAGAFAVYNAVRALEQGNVLGLAGLVPGGGVVSQAARAIPAAASVATALRNRNPAALVSAASQFVPGGSQAARVARSIPAAASVATAVRNRNPAAFMRAASQFVPQDRFAGVPRMLPANAREVFAAGQHAAQAVRTMPGNAAEQRHAAAMVSALAMRSAVARRMQQGRFGGLRR
jgi:hypothetical protein